MPWQSFQRQFLYTCCSICYVSVVHVLLVVWLFYSIPYSLHSLHFSLPVAVFYWLCYAYSLYSLLHSSISLHRLKILFFALFFIHSFPQTTLHYSIPVVLFPFYLRCLFHVFAIYVRLPLLTPYVIPFVDYTFACYATPPVSLAQRHVSSGIVLVGRPDQRAGP